MAGNRGFFAEIQHQNQLAARRQEQAARAAHRLNAAAQRDAERAQQAATRAAAQRARATAAEQKAADREAKRLHEESMVAEAVARNAEAAKVEDEIKSILGATLELDDYVDLESLRVKVEHPPFSREDLATPVSPPLPLVTRPEPAYIEPEVPKGLGSVFGGKKKHAQLVAQQQSEYQAGLQIWKEEVAALPSLQLKQLQEHNEREQQRLAALDEARQKYQSECDQREDEAAESNRRLDALIGGIEYNVDTAIQEYVGIVLGNSVYPDSFPVDHDFEFDPTLKELALTVLVPTPADLPAEKEFKYVKAKDQISATMLPKKDQKERYNNAVFQVALRSLHEIFEADRADRIQTIALKVNAVGTDLATGVEKRSVLVAAAADRETFLKFDLGKVVPQATLEHLGASVSKNPYGLVEIDGSRGVRRG